ncbi:uncharacterized protein PGTG_02647 [Puccinia graminis f. sp. tritici CRL 75-36-700-3]|uniref:Uncharacterized protein n=1 Tax=Puccinia graminis f. sp. tritici (strain CRL 75-36-700-3 / race SCCL) TaxID=418459 RepID=E3JVY1_PUCGT|nr:uncharacterized protein PGTG_02647 [Puccinia graminis f. sp. tritici CRL 75-36-700-3]EFP76206.2 hypothetical protein PGTG_02647 [Puccinia graminis f. sp. tritici CRL 75-36-700-3]
MLICIDSLENDDPSAVSEIELIDLSSSRPNRPSCFPSNSLNHHPHQKKHHHSQQQDPDHEQQQRRGSRRTMEKIDKGKKPMVIDIIEIDSDSDPQPDSSDLLLPKTRPKTPSSTPKNNNNPPPRDQFPLQRIPSAARHVNNNPHHLQELARQFFASTHQELGPPRWNPHIRAIPMNRQEEQSLFDFVDGYPRGDIRLSSILYRKYHRQAPEFSAENYRIYYRAHQSKLEAKHQERPPTSYSSPNRTPNESENQAQHTTTDEEEEEEGVQTTDHTTPESVGSTEEEEEDPLAEIGIDQLLASAGPDRTRIAKTFNIPLHQSELFLALQHDPFPAWPATHPPAAFGPLL